MKNYKMKFLIMVICCVVISLSSEAQCMECLNDGDYNICCHTRHFGKKYLEAFPKTDEVKLREKSLHQDQVWSIKSIENGGYHIFCKTLNAGELYLEAFPILKSHVKPRVQSFGQDQIWLIEPIERSRCLKAFSNKTETKLSEESSDQELLVNPIDIGFYHISCNTQNCGLKHLEAFPSTGLPKLTGESSDQDQMWQFTKSYSNGQYENLQVNY